MKLEKDLLIPYSIATGFFNLLFTAIITIVVSSIFSFPLTWKTFGESFAVGYVVLWIFNLDIIKEK